MLGLFFPLILLLLLLLFNIPLLLSSVYIFMLRPFYLLSISMVVYFLHLLFSFPFMFYSLFCITFSTYCFVVLYILYQCIMIRFSHCKLVPL